MLWIRKQTLTFFFLALCQMVNAQAPNRDIEITHIFSVDAGSGGLWQHSNSDDWYPGNDLEIDQFSPKFSFQSTLGYTLGMELFQFEFKLGYSYISYYMKNISSGGKGSFTTTTSEGNAQHSNFFIQPLGIKVFIKSKWGGIFFGPYVRLSLSNFYKTDGTTITEGSYWDGNGMVPVYSKELMVPFLNGKDAYLGLQLGGVYNLNAQSSIRLRLETNFLSTNEQYIKARQFLFVAGYAYTLPLKK